MAASTLQDKHLFALLDLAESQRVGRVAIHAMLDGRDTLPRSALGFMRETIERARGRARIASVGGRYFGMDRDRRWQRTELFYRAAVDGTGPQITDPLEAIQAAYDAGQSDEFITPAVVVEHGAPVAPVRDGDALICFNYRSDRMRQITRALTEPEFRQFDVTGRPAINAVTMTSYSQQFALAVAFPPISMARIVGEVLSGFRRRRCCAPPRPRSTRTSPISSTAARKSPTPAKTGSWSRARRSPRTISMPEMSAAGVTDVLCKAISEGRHDFILCNYANGDMVGHSGSLPATIQAVETVDQCLARVLPVAQRTGTRLLITADHGNCEQMIDPATGGPHTAHTTNPVPFVLVDGDSETPLRSGAALCDVGPTVLSLLGVEIPPEMTGTDLRVASD